MKYLKIILKNFIKFLTKTKLFLKLFEFLERTVKFVAGIEIINRIRNKEIFLIKIRKNQEN